MMEPLRLTSDFEGQSVPGLSPEAWAFLNHLRFVAMRCRSKPREDLFHACALLHADKAATREAYADALMRCLRQALGQAPKLHAPGVSEVSFDEAWLVSLGQASARGDADSLAFLLGRRVARENQRLIRFLAGQVSECFSLD